VKQLNGEDTSTISPTLGFNITSLALSRRDPRRTASRCRSAAARRYTLNVWDVGGQRTLRAYWRNYYESTDGLVWVLDASDGARLADVKAELHALLEEEKVRIRSPARAPALAPACAYRPFLRDVTRCVLTPPPPLRRPCSWRALRCWCWLTSRISAAHRARRL